MRALLVALVFLIGALLWPTNSSPVLVTLEMRSDTGRLGEVFYNSNGTHYSPDKRKPFAIIPDGQWHAYQVSLPGEQPIDNVRFDPGTRPGNVDVRNISVRSNNHVQRFDGTSLREALGMRHQLRPLPGMEPQLRFASEGADPYFEIRLGRQTGGMSAAARAGIICLLVFAGLLAWLLLEWLVTQTKKRARLPGRLRKLSSRISALVSDEDILRMDGRMQLCFAVLALLAVLYVALGLNQSSVGMWEKYFPAQPVAQTVDIGTAKQVRSDEWMVQTPWILNQVQNGSPTRNPNVGGESAPLLASIPFDSAIGLPQLKYAGFRFLDTDHAVSWLWAYKSFALLMSFLWLLLVLTRGNLAASLLGTGWIYFSSYTQWWFSSNLPEIMSAFAIGVVGALYALFSSRRTMIVVGCLMMVYAAANLILNLYPPFIVPLGYLGLVILCGYFIAHRSPGILQHAGFRSLALLLTIAAAAVYGYGFFHIAADSIQAVLDTVYPGRRVSSSGGVPIPKSVYGFFEVFRFDEHQLPLQPTNASEASSFVLLWPLVLLLLPFRSLARREAALLIGLACFCLIASLWMMSPLPTPLQWLMQKAGWSLVTPKRAILALGVGSILACIVLFARIQRQEAPARSTNARRLAVLLVCSGAVMLGWKLRQLDTAFFSWTVLGAGIAGCSLVVVGIATGRTRLLAAGLAIYALPTFGVNPLISGMSSLLQKPILVAARDQGAQSGNRWMVVGNRHLAQGLKAQGLNVFAGAQFLPDRADLDILDPDGSYQKIWNRYAIVQILSDPYSSKPHFKQTRGNQYSIALDVCSPQVRRLGITHVAYTINVPRQDLACLARLEAPEDSGVNLFRLKH